MPIVRNHAVYTQFIPNLDPLIGAEATLGQAVVYAALQPDNAKDIERFGHFSTLQALFVTPATLYSDPSRRTVRRERPIDAIMAHAGAGACRFFAYDDIVASDRQALILKRAGDDTPLRLAASAPYLMAAASHLAIVDSRAETFYARIVADPYLSAALAETLYNAALIDLQVIRKRITMAVPVRGDHLEGAEEGGDLFGEILVQEKRGFNVISDLDKYELKGSGAYKDALEVWHQAVNKGRASAYILQGMTPAEVSALMERNGHLEMGFEPYDADVLDGISIYNIRESPDTLQRVLRETLKFENLKPSANLEKVQEGHSTLPPPELSSLRTLHQAAGEFRAGMTLPVRPQHGFSIHRTYNELGASAPHGRLEALLKAPAAPEFMSEIVPARDERAKLFSIAHPEIIIDDEPAEQADIFADVDEDDVAPEF